MATYKVYTKWVGYSVVEIDAKSPTEAHEKFELGKYDKEKESLTGAGLDYGFDNEEVIEVVEVKK